MRAGQEQEKAGDLAVRGLAEFIGIYGVTRVIEDARAGAQSRFDGQAVIERDADGAVYVETGALRVNGQRFEAERRYLWRAQPARIFVSFADGTAFHDFDPALGGQASAHLCGDDMYRGGYNFGDWPRWSLTWDVTGPRKDYRSVTQYVPHG